LPRRPRSGTSAINAFCGTLTGRAGSRTRQFTSGTWHVAWRARGLPQTKGFRQAGFDDDLDIAPDQAGRAGPICRPTRHGYGADLFAGHSVGRHRKNWRLEASPRLTPADPGSYWETSRRGVLRGLRGAGPLLFFLAAGITGEATWVLAAWLLELEPFVCFGTPGNPALFLPICRESADSCSGARPEPRWHKPTADSAAWTHCVGRQKDARLRVRDHAMWFPRACGSFVEQCWEAAPGTGQIERVQWAQKALASVPRSRLDPSFGALKSGKQEGGVMRQSGSRPR